jgi:hypothetical protein
MRRERTRVVTAVSPGDVAALEPFEAGYEASRRARSRSAVRAPMALTSSR